MTKQQSLNDIFQKARQAPDYKEKALQYIKGIIKKVK